MNADKAEDEERAKKNEDERVSVTEVATSRRRRGARRFTRESHSQKLSATDMPGCKWSQTEVRPFLMLYPCSSA